MTRKLIPALVALIFILAACAPVQPVLPPTPVTTMTALPVGTPLSPEQAYYATQAYATTFAAATLYPTDPAGQSAMMTQAAATMQAIYASPTWTPVPLTFTDGLDRTVTLASTAQRIVSMAPSNTEILFAVGAGAQVVGRDEFSDYPEAAKALPSIGGSMGQYSNEQIVALKPDLVLAGGINTPEQVKALEDLGLTVYFLKNPTTLEEMYTNLEIIAQMTGHEAETATLVDSLKARVKAVDDKVSTVRSKPVTFYEIDATDANKPYTAGPGTFIDALIARAGGVSFASAAGITDSYPQVGFEKIIEVNPNIILLGDSLYGTTPDVVKQRTGWDALDAVKNGQIFPFDDNLVSRPGPRLVDGLEALAKILHPDLFK